MTSSKHGMVLALVALLGVSACGESGSDAAPAGAGAQQTGAPQAMDPEIMALMMEAQQLRQELDPIQQEAMQDPALIRRMEQIQVRIERVMRDENPELFAQMDEFEARFNAAQEAGDQERAQEIAMEAQGVQQELQSRQQAVLERPEILEPIEAFQEAQRARMIAIDPQAGEIMDRLDEIFASLQMP